MIRIGKTLRTYLLKPYGISQKEWGEWLTRTECFSQPLLIETLARFRLPVCPTCRAPFEEDEVKHPVGMVICPTCLRPVVFLRIDDTGQAPLWCTFHWPN